MTSPGYEVLVRDVAEVMSDPLKQAAAWHIPVSKIFSDETQRLDASNYDNKVDRCLDSLCAAGAKLRRLGDVTTDVFLPPGRPSRNYVEAGYGVPFLQGSHVVHFLPSDLKYIAQDTEQISSFRIKAGWLLLTRSGTVGKSLFARMNGMVGLLLSIFSGSFLTRCNAQVGICTVAWHLQSDRCNC